MATTIRVYNQADNRYYTVTVDATSGVLDAINGVYPNPDPDTEFYLKISTTMRIKSTNTAFPQYVVRTLNDYPADTSGIIPGPYPVPTTFTELIQNFIDYYVAYSELGMSTSSSSTSSNSSSSLSSLSSSSHSSNSSSSISSNSSSSNSSSSISSNSSSSSSSHPPPP